LKDNFDLKKRRNGEAKNLTPKARRKRDQKKIQRTTKSFQKKNRQ